MASLYNLTDAFIQLKQAIEDGIEGAEDTIESIEMAIEDKFEGYAAVIKDFEADVAKLKAEEKRLEGRRKTLENSIKRMKQNVYNTLSVVEGKRVKTEKFTFYIQSNPPSMVLDENLIPQEFKSTNEVTVIDKKAIEEKLKNGEVVEGAKFIQGESIRIR